MTGYITTVAATIQSLIVDKLSESVFNVHHHRAHADSG